MVWNGVRDRCQGHCLPEPRDAKGDVLLVKISKGLLSMNSLALEILSKAVHQVVSFGVLSFEEDKE